MYEHFAPVDALPDKGMIREFIARVPAYFDGEHLIHAADAHDLRQVARKPEHVRQPEDVGIFAEFR